jgi:hypothetical protein
MVQLKLCRIFHYLTLTSQRLFPALACLMLAASVAVHGQIACPPKPGTPVCVTCGSEAKAVCSELKGGNQQIYENCLKNCSAHCPLPPPGPPSTIVAPFDLTWKAVDLNGLPLNPRWALQDSPTCPGLPSAIPLTSFYCAKPWASPCTTQKTKEMPLPSFPSPGSFCPTSGVNGHHENWAVVTYSGAAQWYEHEPWYGDDDYNIYILRDDQSGYTQDNPDGVLTEFDSQETINYFITPWWTAFHTAVDHSDADAEYMLTLLGKPAYIVEVGMMGLDCAHYCSSEIHPTFALAVNVKNEPGDDEWAIFGRNWGDEGFCSSREVVDSDLRKIYLTLPWYPGAADTAPVVAGEVWEEIGEGIQVTTFPQFAQFGSVRRGTGFVVELDLGDARSQPLVSGEIHLKWDMQAGSTSASAGAATIRKVPVAGKSGALRAANSKPEPEKAFAKYLAGLPPDKRRKIKATLVHAHPSRTSIELHATNLSEAPVGFQPHPPRYDASGKDALTNIEIAPDPAKTDAADKINSILREANLPSPPAR